MLVSLSHKLTLIHTNFHLDVHHPLIFSVVVGLLHKINIHIEMTNLNMKLFLLELTTVTNDRLRMEFQVLIDKDKDAQDMKI